MQIIYLFHYFSISTLIVERRVVIKQLGTEIMSPSDLKKFLLQHFQYLELGDSSNRNAEIACAKLLLNLDGDAISVIAVFFVCVVAPFHN